MCAHAPLLRRRFCSRRTTPSPLLKKTSFPAHAGFTIKKSFVRFALRSPFIIRLMPFFHRQRLALNRLEISTTLPQRFDGLSMNNIKHIPCALSSTSCFSFSPEGHRGPVVKILQHECRCHADEETDHAGGKNIRAGGQPRRKDPFQPDTRDGK